MRDSGAGSRVPHRTPISEASRINHPRNILTNAPVVTRGGTSQAIADILILLGFVLFLLGRLAGFAILQVQNPALGLASHIQGLLTGMFLAGLGVVWMKLALGVKARPIAWVLAVNGTFANWAATLLAAIWGAGRSMPIAAGARTGTPVQEMVVDGLHYSLSLAMVILTGMVIWGLRKRKPGESRLIA